MISTRGILGAAAMAITAAILLTGCGPTASPTPTAVPTSVASPTPTTSPAEPAQAFDGDCTAVVEDAEITAAMGTPMSFWAPAWEDGADAALGGVQCGWRSDQYLLGSATVWVYPVSVLDPEYVSGQASNSCDVDEVHVCVISEVFGETWVGVEAYSNDSAEQIERLRPVLADIGERATASSTPAPGDLAGWWLPVITCEELATALTDDGVPTTATDDRPAVGPAFVGGPRARECAMEMTIDGETQYPYVYLEAGAGAGLESRLALDPSQQVDFDGQVFTIAGDQFPDGSPGSLLGSDGVNAASVMSSALGDSPALLAPVLAAVLTAIE